ncbi:MAG: hypothetical protein HYY06_31460 [Deltaproteobacteria bacterium]|nr:hypothetical protein [Deltaproteobacteria bacterium]
MRRSVWIAWVVAGCAGSDQEYRHSESGLSLNVPAGWEAETTGTGTTLSGPPGSAEHRTTINIHSTPVRDDEVARTPESVASALAVQYRAMDASHVRVRGRERLARTDAWLVEARFDRDGTRYRRQQYVTEHRGRIVHLDATAPETQWATLEPIFERALDTARWR